MAATQPASTPGRLFRVLPRVPGRCCATPITLRVVFCRELPFLRGICGFTLGTPEAPEADGALAPENSDYWEAVLEDCGLGLNRGTTFPEEDLLANEADRAHWQQLRKKKTKLGRPRKCGAPKGRRARLTRAEIKNVARFTSSCLFRSGMFAYAGIRRIPTMTIGAGRGQRGGRKGPEGGRDDQKVSGAFIQYLGGSDDIAILEETITKAEIGRVRPTGHGGE